MRRSGSFGVARLALTVALAALGLGGALGLSHEHRGPGTAAVSGQRGQRSVRRGAGGAAARTTRGPRPIALPRSASKLLGQRIMVGLSGTVAGSALLATVRRGDIGSVILFGSNLVSRAQTVALTGALQHAARAGGNPPLLIATDQEGGQVKRLAAGPPDLSPPQMAATHDVAVAAREGRATGSYLRSWGIDMDLAPVADVPTFGGAFIARQGRSFSSEAGTVAQYATAFALGLQARGVAATAKHFPGLGSAVVSTDIQREELHPTRAQRLAALTPYQTMIPRGLDAVMLAVAGFPGDDASGAPAALSRPIIAGLLRGRLGFQGVTITDALGFTTGHSETVAGTLAAAAGADILLFTDSAPGELESLRAALRSGAIKSRDAAASYRRIVSLKQHLGTG